MRANRSSRVTCSKSSFYLKTTGGQLRTNVGLCHHRQLCHRKCLRLYSTSVDHQLTTPLCMSRLLSALQQWFRRRLLQMPPLWAQKPLGDGGPAGEALRPLQRAALAAHGEDAVTARPSGAHREAPCHEDAAERPRTGLMVDPEEMKQRIRESLLRPQYDVTEFYH